MSGHSKWSTIKRQKGVADIKRGQQFTKLSNAITIAAKQGGGSIDANFKLRLIIEAARSANMPKDNITRAIERGSGKSATGTIDEITYEAFGPHGVALLIDTVTDNRLRTAASIRSTVERANGSMGGAGSVSWMFKQMGEIEVKKVNATADDIILAAADFEAVDFEDVGNCVLVFTSLEDLEKVKIGLSEKQFQIERFEPTKRPTNVVQLEDPNKAKQVLDLVEKLEELEDVQKVYSNFDIDEKILQEVAG